MSERIVENTWLCPACNNKNLGRYDKCQSCGKIKDKYVRDIVPGGGEAPTVTDATLLKKANAGANWVCSYCDGQTRDLNGECVNCGADRKEAQHQDVRDFHQPPKPPPSRPFSPPPAPKRPSNLKQYIVLLALAFATVGGIGSCTWWFFAEHEVKATVSSATWKYTSNLHQRVTRDGSRWDSAPSGAFDVTHITKQDGTKKCNPYDCNFHEETYKCNPYSCNEHTVQESYRCRPHDCNCHETCRDKGNGFSSCRRSCSTCYDTCYKSVSKHDTCYRTCSRTVHDTCWKQCPVYREWYSYRYFDWPIVSTLVESGNTHEVRWPVLEATGDQQRLSRTEEYTVTFTDGQDSWTWHPKNLGEFTAFRKSAIWVISVTHSGAMHPVKADD